MASPASNPKNDELRPDANVRGLSEISDKNTNPQKVQNLAPKISKETDENEIALPSATPETNDGATGQVPESVVKQEDDVQIPTSIFLPGSVTGLDVDSNATETDYSDSDSAIGNSVNSSTFSTRSSVYDFVEENGRTYHRFKEGKYYLPNDEVSPLFRLFIQPTDK